MNSEERPKVSVGVLIFKDGKVLLGKRLSSHGDGSYCGPGGHVEHLESLEEAVKREAREEVGIEIKNVQFLCVVNIKDYAPKHYINIGFTAEWNGGEVKGEEGVIDHWDWYDLDNLPTNLFASVAQFFDAYKTNRRFYDSTMEEDLARA